MTSFAVTPGEVRQWMYRYLQRHTGWFDSPDWKVEGDQYIPQLVAAFERLAEHIATLDDEDPRLVSLADALNEANSEPEDLEGTSTPTTPPLTASPGANPEPDDFISSYVPVAVGIIRVDHKRRRS